MAGFPFSARAYSPSALFTLGMTSLAINSIERRLSGTSAQS
jgi:hypothetical protein